MKGILTAAIKWGKEEGEGEGEEERVEEGKAAERDKGLFGWSYSQHNQTCPYKSALQTRNPHQVGGEAQKKTWIWGFGREPWTQETPFNQWPNKTLASTSPSPIQKLQITTTTTTPTPPPLTSFIITTSKTVPPPLMPPPPPPTPSNYPFRKTTTSTSSSSHCSGLSTKA